MSNWYWFTARKDGNDKRERIPAATAAEAVEELHKLGYTDIVIFDVHPASDYRGTYAM